MSADVKAQVWKAKATEYLLALPHKGCHSQVSEIFSGIFCGDVV